MELSPQLFLLLAPFIFFGGFVDAIAGGGGIITIPAYLAAGLPANLVLGTNKLSSSLGTIVSTYNYYLRVKGSLRQILPMLVAAIVGSATGARTVLLLDPGFIRWLLIGLIPLTAYLIYKNKKFGAIDNSHELPPEKLRLRLLCISFSIGFYDGFFGPGTGTFLALAFTRFARFDLIKATAYAKYINLTSNLAALVVFLSKSTVAIPLGLALGIVGILGHYLGSKAALHKGQKFIRPMIIVVLAGLMVKVVLDY